MPKVIDEFIIKVKLDTSEYEAGQKKLDKQARETKERAKEAGNAFGDAMESAAKKSTNKLGILGSMLGKGGMIGVAVGSLIYAGKVLDDKLFDIAKGVRQVGIDGKNFNIAAAGLRNLQNASEMANGSLEDANKTVGGLAGSLYNLKFNGAVDDSLIALGRLGVHFQDSYGRAKDFNAVMLETADAIDKAKASGRMTDSEAFFFAGQAGFTGGMQNLVTSGRGNVERELARQEARRQITGDTLKGANDWVRASTSLGQSVVSEAGLRGVDTLAGKRAEADAMLEKTGKTALEWMSDLSATADKLEQSFERATNRVDAFLGTSQGATGAAVNTASALASGPVGMALRAPSFISSLFNGSSSTDTSVSRGIRNNNPLNLRAVGDQPHDDKGFRVFNSMDEGIAAADEQLARYQKRGITTMGDMISTWAPPNENDTKAYIANMTKMTGMSATHVVAPEERATLERAMAKQESGANITIDEINIHTQATDAQGISRDIGGALTRNKQLTALAERGAQ